jgi:hypothetical protein
MILPIRFGQPQGLRTTMVNLSPMRPENLEEWRGNGKACGLQSAPISGGNVEHVLFSPLPLLNRIWSSETFTTRVRREERVFFFLPLHVLNVGSLPESFFYPPSCCSIGVGPGGGRSI